MTKVRQIEIGSATDVGNVRRSNEDRVVADIIPCGASAIPAALLLVADGLGGHEGGEMASMLAQTTLREVVAQPMASGKITSTAISRMLAGALKLANKRIYEAGGDVVHGRPGTTMTACLLSAQRYDLAHVGDSRAFLITPHSTLQLTDDDSVVADAVRQGTMTNEQARSSPYRNQLTRSIGTSEQVDPSIYHGPIDAGDVVAICSDGLSEYITPEEMHDAILGKATLQHFCDDLVQLAKQRGGHDNISLVAARAGTWADRQAEVGRARDRMGKAHRHTTLPLLRPFNRKH
ncbi:MAG: protein phosphatase 2C domain-containing protein [Capsulimonadaceae bacterium]|nr:protein phosphatase 2C domain-containing protein [Capsulimonadaceae bacterium]